ncbi:MAG: hypothetical protein RIS75_609 [Actinomycetota bacterium]
MAKLITTPKPSFAFTVLFALALPAVLSTYFSFQINTVTSGSMRPTIEPGDAIVTVVKPARDLEPGDIVLLFDLKTNVVQSHRITQEVITGDQIKIITRGDANPREDTEALVFNSTPIRTSILILPKLGFVLTFLSTNSSQVIAIAFGAFVLFVSIRSFLKLDTNHQSKEEFQ